MNNRKFLVKGLRGMVCMAVLIAVLAVCGCEGNRNLTLEKIAYDKSKDNPVVYLKENNEYVPYLVLTSDYDGNVLLLRKNVLSELKQYKQHGMLWSHFEYGSYYEESSIDEFLNTEFLEVFSPEVKAAIVDTTIEVTDIESYDKWNYATHTLERKVFLLSSVELGVKGLDGYTTTVEGRPLKYFRNKEYSVKAAYTEEGKACPYWTRTPELWESYTVIMMGIKKVGGSNADIYSGVRPAFCMEKDTIIQKSDSIIAGESVYVIGLDYER